MAEAGLRAHLRLAYPGFALDVDLALPGRGITALFGHSGSGKTTLLRCVAGLEKAAGRLCVNGETWQDDGVFLPTHRRPLGYVFQEASLFPHLTVRGNLEYGMRRAGGIGRVDFGQVTALLGIGDLLERRPDRLSGGERQRVAIARALLTRPQILLMDEPLAALDPARKSGILPYLERLHDELAIPVLYVTHSVDEVARLADYLVVLEAGRAVAAGPLAETFGRLDLPLAQDEGAGTVLAARVAGHDADGLTRLAIPGGEILVPRRGEAVGQPVRLRITARDVSLALAHHQDTSILNVLPATVTGFAEVSGQVMVSLDAGGTRLLARITQRSWDRLALRVGAAVHAQIKSVALF
ncbi:MAG: molybdenum ABC transporter ATP-binding protein [Rhodocyclaceae bacterium]|nr:molybdenum ABC transporter ATP-binding protein [Rhodocyclaceae bacterium]